MGYNMKKLMSSTFNICILLYRNYTSINEEFLMQIILWACEITPWRYLYRNGIAWSLEYTCCTQVCPFHHIYASTWHYPDFLFCGQSNGCKVVLWDFSPFLISVIHLGFLSCEFLVPIISSCLFLTCT